MGEVGLKAIAKEILWYSTKNDDGTYRIPICLDFDFTCTRNSSWIQGTWDENPHCFETLKKWQKLGCVFILDTMRGKRNIEPAIDFLRKNDIFLYGIGRNPDQDSDGYVTNKAWGVFSIDDRNMGSFNVDDGQSRPYIDWYKVDEHYTPIIERISQLLPQMEEEVKMEMAEVTSKN